MVPCGLGGARPHDSSRTGLVLEGTSAEHATEQSSSSCGAHALARQVTSPRAACTRSALIPVRQVHPAYRSPATIQCSQENPKHPVTLPGRSLVRLASSGGLVGSACTYLAPQANRLTEEDATSVGDPLKSYFDNQLKALDEKLGAQIERTHTQVNWLCESGLPVLERKVENLQPDVDKRLVEMVEKFQTLCNQVAGQARSASAMDRSLRGTISGLEQQLSTATSCWRDVQDSQEDRLERLEALVVECKAEQTISAVSSRRSRVSDGASVDVESQDLSTHPMIHLITDTQASLASPASSNQVDDWDGRLKEVRRLARLSKVALDPRTAQEAAHALDVAMDLVARTNHVDEIVSRLTERVGQLTEDMHRHSASLSLLASVAEKPSCGRGANGNGTSAISDADVLAAVNHLDELSQVVQGFSDSLEEAVQEVATGRKDHRVLRDSHAELEAVVRGLTWEQKVLAGHFCDGGFAHELMEVRREIGELQLAAGIQREVRILAQSVSGAQDEFDEYPADQLNLDSACASHVFYNGTVDASDNIIEEGVSPTARLAKIGFQLRENVLPASDFSDGMFTPTMRLSSVTQCTSSNDAETKAAEEAAVAITACAAADLSRRRFNNNPGHPRSPRSLRREC